ncbi:glycosyltransferase family 4 protein [Candidatus Shapirobacteria bacterium]|nr:glycosyltransferase family 4 protein [Candidatus Shapirobacteria bacterium]
MKVALVYDRVNKWGGAERVLLALHEIWPEAPLYTAVYNPETAPWADVFKVIPSFLQKAPFFRNRHEILAPLMPMAFESFNFDEFDVVISITSEAAKGIITKPKTLHVCYCLTPTRYLWSGYGEYFGSAARRLGSWAAVEYLRKWDKIAAQRPDYYVAISKNVKERIKKYYGRESEVIYPPVDTEKFEISPFAPRLGGLRMDKQNSKYFLVVSRLVPYKKVDLVVGAFNELDSPLKIIGVGSEMGRLKMIARANIEFLGQLTDEELFRYYQGCRAVIFPQEEDFGLVPLEAQACGKPVIAYRGGGALETVAEGKTGVFFDQPTSQSLIKAIEQFSNLAIGEKDCREQAEKFNKERFKREIKNYIERLY